MHLGDELTAASVLGGVLVVVLGALAVRVTDTLGPTLAWLLGRKLIASESELRTLSQNPQRQGLLFFAEIRERLRGFTWITAGLLGINLGALEGPAGGVLLVLSGVIFISGVVWYWKGVYYGTFLRDLLKENIRQVRDPPANGRS